MHNRLLNTRAPEGRCGREPDGDLFAYRDPRPARSHRPKNAQHATNIQYPHIGARKTPLFFKNMEHCSARAARAEANRRHQGPLIHQMDWINIEEFVLIPAHHLDSFRLRDQLWLLEKPELDRVMDERRKNSRRGVRPPTLVLMMEKTGRQQSKKRNRGLRLLLLAMDAIVTGVCLRSRTPAPWSRQPGRGYRSCPNRCV